MNKCRYCIVGNVTPRYRHGKQPRYCCDNSEREYVPRTHPGGDYRTHMDRRIRSGMLLIEGVAWVLD